MTHIHLVRRASPFALTMEELDCLDRLHHGALSGGIPRRTRSYLLSRGYLEAFKDGVMVTPRGRTALLCGRP
jgi:hypothetical protein